LTDPDEFLQEATRVFPETMVERDHLQFSLQFSPDPP
jgi:hypothetical protein